MVCLVGTPIPTPSNIDGVRAKMQKLKKLKIFKEGQKMKKGTFEQREYVFVVYEDDGYLEYIQYVGDTLKDAANYLGILESGASKLLNRDPKFHYKKIRIEKVKIYDFVYVIYDETIQKPLYVARSIDELAKKSSYSKGALRATLYNSNSKPYTPLSQRRYKIRKPRKEYIHKLDGKYLVKCIDLLDLDFYFARFLENCMLLDNINHEEYKEVEV